MQRFPPNAMVTAAVTFSRCLYAQLVQQAIQAPDSLTAAPPQVPAFKPPLGLPLPPPGDSSRKAAELGMKLTMGMEIMCSDKLRADRGTVVNSSPAVCIESTVGLMLQHATRFCHVWKSCHIVRAVLLQSSTVFRQ